MAGYYSLAAYYPLLEILVLCFNAILFVLLSVLLIRKRGNRSARWGGWFYPAAVIALAVFFVAHLAKLFAAGLRMSPGILWVPEMTGKHLIPPLVFHLFYWNERDYLPRRRLWRAFLAAAYALGIVSAALAINTSVFGGYPGWPAVDLLGRATMVAGACGTGLSVWLSRRPREGALERNQMRWLIGICLLWAAAFLGGRLVHDDLAKAIEKVPPVLFIFVITYYVERFTFFDVVIKKAAFVFASLFLLTLYFVFFAPVLLHLRFTTWIGSLAWAVTIWPIVLLGPWGHRKLSAWLDRLWLGRRFSPAAAAKFFFSGLEGAMNEEALARDAAVHLETIFGSKVEVSFAEPVQARRGNGECIVADIRAGGRAMGEIRVHPREHNPRFLSEDVTLLASLADALAFLLENLRLHEKRREQEKRESELMLNARLSELKALRAQVNPHFLFNALNTIAGLIPRHPGRAEETVEELAEVFRYALHRSDREWVRLGEELDAVQSYLHVEQARFGEALRFRITADARARDVQIPAMIVQTLVENAVKHGIARVKTAGTVDVRASTSHSRLRIEVRDTGPGFSSSQPPRTPNGGYGLVNIRERLSGYFGASAGLTTGRDPESGMTLASIEMPLAKPAAAEAKL